MSYPTEEVTSTNNQSREIDPIFICEVTSDWLRQT